MKKMNAMEMRTVEGGATYSKTCRYCGKKFKAKYFLFISYLSAKATVGAAVHNHEIECFAKKVGF